MIDTNTVKQSVDLPALAGTLTTLRKESTNEYSGPCPKCGGADRFHANRESWMCRQCSPRWNDAITLLMWHDNIDFQSACARLGQGGFSPVKQNSSPTKPKTFSADFWTPKIESARDRIWTDSGSAARDYLTKRGIEDRVWIAYGLGYDRLSVGNQGEFEAAVTLPWFVRGELTGFSVRYISKYHKAKMGDFGGKLYGGWLLGEHGRTCVLVEGEINAMSIYQVANHTRLDVLSLGSQTAKLSQAAINHIAKYDHIIIWADEQATANRWASHFSDRAHAFASPHDANELLQSGQLGGVLSALRARIADETDSTNLLRDDLQHGADTLLGLDDGSMTILAKLSKDNI